MNMSTPELALEIGSQMGDNPLVASADDRSAFPPSSAEKTLASLIERSKGGDAGAMESIYHRFNRAFFSLALRYGGDRATAEDLLQEIFIKIFTHIESVRSAEMFPGWAYRIALNSCYSHLREKRAKSSRTVSLEDVGDLAREDDGAGRESDLRKPLEEAVALLPRRLKEIFLLHDVQGFKHEEIAVLLRLSAGTSKSQLFKARLRIREFLKARKIGPGGRS